MSHKAIFLDRDGVINRERGEYTWKPQDFEILPGIGEFIAQMKSRNFKVIVVTNQGGIGKGLYLHEDYWKTERILFEQLGPLGALPDAIYYCPHHPSTSKCICRKPQPLLIEKAIARFDIDATQSYFIGDKERDMEAAAACNVKGILIEANSSIFSIIDQIQ